MFVTPALFSSQQKQVYSCKTWKNKCIVFLRNFPLHSMYTKHLASKDPPFILLQTEVTGPNLGFHYIISTCRRSLLDIVYALPKSGHHSLNPHHVFHPHQPVAFSGLPHVIGPSGEGSPFRSLVP